jgi:predicted TIM-barrel fold metal-dependent hydrolase
MAIGRKYIAGAEHRPDRMAAAGLFEDGLKGFFRPTTPELRIKDQDLDGVQAEVLYGLLGVGHKMTDREASVELYHIYNEWLADFCAYDKRRFVGLASIPSHSVEAAVAEARHAAKLGLGGLDFSPYWGMKPLWHMDWEPLWQVAAEANLAVHFHTIGAQKIAIPDDTPEVSRLANQASQLAGFQMYVGTYLASVIHSGALERHPRLRIVLGESGIGWIPYVLDRMDWEYEERFEGRIPLKMKPSEYWRRQCRATFQDDALGLRLLDVLGVENVMWGSDYPHADGVWPDSQEYIRKQFSHLPAEVHRKITCENVGRFYGLIK